MTAHRGESGYCWTSDLDGPRPLNHEEVEWLRTTDSRREVAVYKTDGETQVGIFIVGGGYYSYTKLDGTTGMKQLSNRIAQQPPVWLFDQMKSMATSAGDANAWAWWTLTTAEEAALVTGNSAAGIVDPKRPVYLATMLGDFTNWLWSLPEGTSAPEYSWIYEVIDADSSDVESTGASPKPFEAAENSN